MGKKLTFVHRAKRYELTKDDFIRAVKNVPPTRVQTYSVTIGKLQYRRGRWWRWRRGGHRLSSRRRRRTEFCRSSGSILMFGSRCGERVPFSSLIRRDGREAG